MKTTMRVERPDEIEASITITMKVKDWRELQRQLAKDWPSWRLSSQITDLVLQVQRVYSPTPESDG